MSDKNILNLDLKNIFTTMMNNYLTENEKKNKDQYRKTINLYNYDGINDQNNKNDDDNDILEDIFLLLEIIKKEKKLDD